MTQDRRSVIFAGGGTAGHVFPALAVARALRAATDRYEPVFVGTEDRLEGRLVPEAGFRLHHIEALPVPRRPSPTLVRLPFSLRRSLRRVRSIVEEEDPVAAVSFGGYVSFPVVRVVSRAGIPLVIHEQNAVPGLANRVASRWADRIAVTFPGSADRFKNPERVAVTGNPVRNDILDLDLDARRPKARDRFELDPQTPTILVFGGSQGARSINRAVTASASLWPEDLRVQILHAAGRALFRETAAAWEQARPDSGRVKVRCLDFIDDMPSAYAAADVVVCRAGATSIAELSALGLPALLIPYPHATGDHQLANARALERAGGAAVLEDDELSGRAIVATIAPWLADPAARAGVASASRAFGRRDAAANVTRLVLDLIRS